MATDPHTACIPALMKPCTAKRSSDYASLVAKGRKLTDVSMTSVLYRDSLGDWPLLAHSQPQESVARPAAAGVPLIVGPGAIHVRETVSHAAHTVEIGVRALLPRCSSDEFCRAAHLPQSSQRVSRPFLGQELDCRPSLTTILPASSITRAVFLRLRREFPNLTVLKQSGSRKYLRYAAEPPALRDHNVSLCCLHGSASQ